MGLKKDLLKDFGIARESHQIIIDTNKILTDNLLRINKFQTQLKLKENVHSNRNCGQEKIATEFEWFKYLCFNYVTTKSEANTSYTAF